MNMPYGPATVDPEPSPPEPMPAPAAEPQAPRPKLPVRERAALWAVIVGGLFTYYAATPGDSPIIMFAMVMLPVWVLLLILFTLSRAIRGTLDWVDRG